MEEEEEEHREMASEVSATAFSKHCERSMLCADLNPMSD